MKRVLLVILCSLFTITVFASPLSDSHKSAVKALLSSAKMPNARVMVITTGSDGFKGFTTDIDYIEYPAGTQQTRQSGSGVPPGPGDFNTDLGQIGVPFGGAGSTVTFGGTLGEFTFSFTFEYVGGGSGSYGNNDWEARDQSVTHNSPEPTIN